MNTTVRTLAVTAALVAAACSPAGAADPVSTSKVTYVTASSVYVEAGTEEGLNVGDRAEVLRDGKVHAVLEVTYASAHKAVCGRTESSASVEVGDQVRFTPRFPAPAASVAAVPAAAAAGADAAAGAKSATSERPVNIHGRVGARFLAARQRGGAEFEYQQPSLDLRLDGTQIFGLPIDLGVDVRARRTSRTYGNGTSESEGRTRVYQAALAWQQPNGPMRVSAGRQFSPSLAVVSLFDGVSAEYRRDRWAAGLFTGSQPDPVTMGYSGDVREHGGFFEYRSASGAERRWAVTTGAVGSYENGEINREFAFLQGRYDDRRLSAYATAEIDVNRGWREDAGESSISRTGTFLSVRWRVGQNWSINAGADDRRNVRLYRDFVSPETEFDDRWRRGYWAGFDGGAGAHLRFGLDARRSTAEGDETADALTARVGASRFTRFNLGAFLRATRYENEYLEGSLYSLSVSADLAEWSRLELHGGLRDETVLTLLLPEETHTWYGFDWDLYLARRWFAVLSYERSQDQDQDTDQLHATLTWRF